MAVKAGIKAGLIGAGVVFVLTLLGRIPLPFIGCVCCLTAWLAYVGAGALAGYFTDPPRNAGTGAGAGAIAGAISGTVSGLMTSVFAAIGGGNVRDYTSFLDPEMVRQLQEAGIDPQSFTTATGAGSIVLVAAVCCLSALVLGAALGALGGALYCSTNKE